MTDPVPVPVFPKHDPTTPAFWDVRFQTGFLPWDRGRAADDFCAFVRQHDRLRTLIPGCGSAHEAKHLAELGWPVTALDFSPQAVTRAKNSFAISGLPTDNIIEADFFDPRWAAEPWDWVYESAFLCALPPALRQNWATQMAAVTQRYLAGYFYFGDAPGGPPFGISEAALGALLTPNFELLESRVPTDSIAVFAGKERWMVWQRH